MTTKEEDPAPSEVPKPPFQGRQALTIEGQAAVETALAVELIIEASCSAIPAGVPQRIELFDFDAGSFEQVDERVATPGDSVVSVVVAEDPSRFIHAGTRRLQAKVSWFDPGNVILPGWVSRTDQSIWVVTR